MATHQVHNLFDDKTYHLIAGSTEYFRISLFDSETKDEIDLSSVDNIEWFLGTASVKNEFSEVKKSLLNNEIIILKDSDGNNSNVIQVTLEANDTNNFQGAYIHQILITDGSGAKFRPFQGLLVFSRALQ